MSEEKTSGFHSQFGRSFLASFISIVSLHVRKKMYALFAKEFLNSKNVLDVGVTSENVAAEANFFEEMFPFKEKITAVGIEDAGYLEKKYKGLKFVKVKEGESLPFAVGEFEVSFSNAVIEHIIRDDDRKKFISELLRVSRNVFLTTPNKFFPLEVHTGVPILHFLWPRSFNFLMDRKIVSKFYNTSNLKPLDHKDLRKIAESFGIPYEIHAVRLCGFISNWVLIFKQKN